MITVDAKAAKKALKDANNMYRPHMQLAIQEFLERTRLEAVKEIVPSRYPHIKNPNKLRKLQPCTPGKVTERTGKLIWALKEGAHPKGGGFSKGNRTVKQTSMYEMMVSRSLKTSLESYVGTIKFSFLGHPVLFDKSREMPKETSQTFYFRAMWDKRGINGAERRKYLTSAAEKLDKQTIIAIADKRLKEVIFKTRLGRP